MLTNRINVTYNIENIDADFDIFRVEKANKDYYKYNILDSAVYEFKAAAVQWTFGATALVLFRKGEVTEKQFKERHVIDEEDWIIVENTHEPIVDKELFDRVRKVLGQKVFSSDRGRNLPIKDDIFAGILFCGNCKRRIPQLSRIVEKDGRLERQYFYSCKYNYDFGGEKCGCTILEQELVKAVYKILEVNIAALSDCGKMENVLQSAMEKELKKCDVQIRQLEKKIEKLNYEESKGYQGYVTGEVSKEEFRRMQEKSSDAVMRLRGQISDEEANRRRYKRFFGKKLQWLRAIYRFQRELYLDRNMLVHLGHSIYLYPDNRIKINLNFKDEYAERVKEEA